MKSTFLFLIIVLFSIPIVAQITVIPDPKFEQKLINLGYDNSINGGVITANIDTITNLDLSSTWPNDKMSDPTGLEDFTSLEYLNISNNLLSDTLDLTNNVNLISLDANTNQSLDYINVSNCPNLKFMYCSWTSMNYLDISNNTLLEVLDYPAYNTANLNFTNNPNLKILTLYSTNSNITSLDFSSNPLLEELFLTGAGNVNSLNVTNNLNLKKLVFDGSLITSLNLSNNTALERLSLHQHKLSSLNLVNNTSLNNLVCKNYGSELTCLNIKNGNNQLITNFDARDNYALTCIQVDNVIWSFNNWNDKDVTASYNTDCGNPCVVGINEQELNNFSYYPNPTSNSITIDLGETKTNINATIKNTLGQVILNKTFNSTNIITLDIDAPKGIYFVQLAIKDKVYTKKIIKE